MDNLDDDVDGSVHGRSRGGPAPSPLGPFEPWIGTWRGGGRGDFPTIEAFTYVEEVTFATTGKPVLSYGQRTRSPDGQPMHAERGFVRIGTGHDTSASVRVEWVIAQPTGLVETATGQLDGNELTTTSRVFATPTAVDVRAVRRRYAVVGDVLTYDLWMATADVPTLTHHLAAELHRDDGGGAGQDASDD